MMQPQAAPQAGPPWEPGVLATLIQSQDSITWLAFSLAVTTESVLLAAFAQTSITDKGKLMLTIAGPLLGIAFLLIIIRSNGDMNTLYGRAAKRYPSTFALGARSINLRAQYVMYLVLAGWIVGWPLIAILA